MIFYAGQYDQKIRQRCERSGVQLPVPKAITILSVVAPCSSRVACQEQAFACNEDCVDCRLLQYRVA